MCLSIYGTAKVHEMYCVGLKLKFVVCDMPIFTALMPLLSLDSLQKVGFLAGPAGGAVEKNGQLVSPVTVEIHFTLSNYLKYLNKSVF